MVMTEARKLALDYAVTAATLTKRETVPADEIVATAEKFHAFLVGQPSATGATQATEDGPEEDLGELVDDFLASRGRQNVVPISQADFGKADQSPAAT